MTVPTDDPSLVWTPQPLPADDVLAREPDPDEVALVAALATEAAEAAEPEVVAPEAPPEPEPEVAVADAEVPGEAADATGPDAAADAAAQPPVTPVPDDAALPPSVQLLHSSEEPSAEDQRGWTGLLVGVVIAMFFVFVPVQVMVGSVIPWVLAFLVGGTLTIAGGIATGRDVLRRGTTRTGALLGFALGVLILLGCAVATVIGAQGAS